MKIHAYIQTWNEATLMPYILRHYGSFCDKLIFNDDGSTDGTREMITACPIAELRDLGSGGVNDEIFLKHWTEDYKESRGEADWVILVDADEFIYHHDLRAMLEQYREHGVTMPLVQGYQMFSEEAPTTDGQIYQQLNCGFEYSDESKRAIFNPMLDVVYWHGRHRLNTVSPPPVENPSGTPDIALLHYVGLGWDYFAGRRKSYQPRMSTTNRERHWGDYIFADDGRRGEFEAGIDQAKRLERIMI